MYVKPKDIENLNCSIISFRENVYIYKFHIEKIV